MDPFGMFPLFLKRTAHFLPPHLAVVFRLFLCLSNFPVCWRVAKVSPITKGHRCSDDLLSDQILTNFLITCIHVQGIWASFIDSSWEVNGMQRCFQPLSLLIGKVLALVMLLILCHSPYASETGKFYVRWGIRLELFRSTSIPMVLKMVDRVNHQRILFNFCSMGVWVSVLSFLT